MPKTCLHCKHYDYWYVQATWEDPGDEGAACRKEDDLSSSLFETFDCLEWEPEAIAPLCPLYEPMTLTCSVCGKTASIDEHPWLSVSEFFTGDPLDVCSADCKAVEQSKQDVLAKRYDEIEKEQEQSEREYWEERSAREADMAANEPLYWH